MKTKTLYLSRLEVSLILIHANRFGVKIENLSVHGENLIKVRLKGQEKDVDELINFIVECNSE